MLCILWWLVGIVIIIVVVVIQDLKKKKKRRCFSCEHEMTSVCVVKWRDSAKPNAPTLTLFFLRLFT